MKIYFLFLAILLSNLPTGSKITYQAKQKKSYILNSSLPVKIKKAQLRKANQLSIFTLEIVDGNSFFHGNDSPTIFFKNHEKKESYMLLKSDLNRKEPYAVRWKKGDFNWQVDRTQQKKILGYDCFLATTSEDGFEYKVWFAPDLPYSDGPYRFLGLDGLILELETKVMVIQASKIEQNQDVLFKIPEAFKFVSRQFLSNRLMKSKR